jgi:hypothetical protein
MKAGMSLEALLSEVQRQNSVKRDFTTSTEDNVRMVEAEDLPNKVAVVMLKDGAAELERFAVSEQAHKQIAARLNIPSRYYLRLLADHRDLVVHQVNALFEREPASRLFRTLDGTLRAFLSDRYLRLDNNDVLEQTLPAIVKGELETQLLSTNVGENKMHMKVLFTGDELAHEVTSRTKDGSTRIIRPGFRMSNSETGQGTLAIEGFFYDGYCLNGCVFGQIEAFSFKRTHLGGRLIEGVDFEVLSDQSRELEDKAIISQVSDVMTALANPEFAQKMVTRLRATTETGDVQSPIGAVDLAVKELDLREDEKESILTTFIEDRDYSQWGLASAITQVANKEATTYERSCELENVGANVIDLNQIQWNRFVQAEKIAA